MRSTFTSRRSFEGYMITMQLKSLALAFIGYTTVSLLNINFNLQIVASMHTLALVFRMNHCAWNKIFVKGGAKHPWGNQVSPASPLASGPSSCRRLTKLPGTERSYRVMERRTHIYITYICGTELGLSVCVYTHTKLGLSLERGQLEYMRSI